MKFVAFKANNGQKIRFWKDKWVGDTSFNLAFPDLFNIYMKEEAKVAECWNADQNDWDLGFRREIFL